MESFTTSAIAFVSASFGAIIGALNAALCAWITQRGETRRLLVAQSQESKRQLGAELFKFALRLHEFDQEVVSRMNEQAQGQYHVQNLFLSDYLVIALSLEKIIDSKDAVGKDNLKLIAEEFDGVFNSMREYRTRFVSEKVANAFVANLAKGDPLKNWREELIKVVNDILQDSTQK